MATRGSQLLARLRQPAYTGENRCLPCTLVNGVIAVVLAALATVVATPPAGAVVLVASLSAIYLRGYLVPGTPELTKRYLPDRVLRLFGKAPDVPDPGDAVDVEAYLREIGALDAGATDDLELTAAFRTVWADEIDEARSGTAAIAGDVLDLSDPGVDERGDAYVVTDGGVPAADWPSRAALLADLGAISVLSRRDPAWGERSRAEQGQILTGLRVFLESCPSCGGEPVLGEETVESCCRAAEVYSYTCPDCGARLLEIER